jgi:hypothetical protein
MTENRDFVRSVRIYYARDDKEELSLGELKKRDVDTKKIQR